MSDTTRSKDPLLVIAGPTAVGKSEIALRLAGRIGGSILSGDSVQVYRGMDIGSAKPSLKEMQSVPHYLIDCRSPREEWNAFLFQKEAEAAFQSIRKESRIPILTGGTGFYIDAFVYGTSFTESADPETEAAVMQRITHLAEEGGAEALWQLLRESDLASAEAIHPHNVKRVKRALFFSLAYGKPLSEHNAEEKTKAMQRPTLYIVLTMDRPRLYERINERVDRMMAAGFLEEVRRLREAGYTGEEKAMQAIGYRELFRYLQEEIPLSEAVEEIKKNTRHYAKRQLTWFLKNPDAVVKTIEEDETAETVTDELERMTHAFLQKL